MKRRMNWFVKGQIVDKTIGWRNEHMDKNIIFGGSKEKLSYKKNEKIFFEFMKDFVYFLYDN